MNTRFQISSQRGHVSLWSGMHSGPSLRWAPRSKWISLHGPHGPVGPDCQKFFNRSENAKKMAIGGFVSGGALAIGAIIGFVVSADDGAPERRMSFAPAIGPDGAGASWSLRF